ncbi:MobQ family relaxase [Bacillus thuringiensis]|uniref:MobQ family relaxase n=1 Tax=Bacillus thuringiensis TaxID=1428 RepID=UPI0025A57AC0|nr:MobQ family relaxase [Bacillus thuringiensis]MDM8365719.1 MobQ family relaxase [Bacillus thuringiensis]
MAIFYYDVNILNKADHSAVATAAYDSDQSLYSERDDEIKKYRPREVAPESYILAPSHAPVWVKDREKLWNEVEFVEKQWNAQLARRLIFALPVELSEQEQIEILLQHCQECFVDEGMVADISIHREHAHNPHAHVLLTMRPFNKDGTWGLKKKKVNGKTVSMTTWNDRGNVTKWRENWATLQNEKFLEKGLDIRVSHESYEKQGLDIVPTKHIGYKSYAMEQRAKEQALKEGKEYKPVTHYGKENAEIAKYNDELRKLEKEEVILLEEYKKEKQNQRQQFDFKMQLTPDERVAVEKVKNRVKRFVDYKVALDTAQSLGNWKRKLEKQEREIQAEKNILNRANHTYKSENDKQNIDYYGFHVEEKLFAQQMQERISNLQKRTNELEEEKNKFDDLYTSVHTVISLHKQFVEQEFETLYEGNYQELDTLEKYHVLQQFTKHGIVMNDEEIQTFITTLQSTNQKLYDVDLEHARRSFVITGLSVRKKQNEHRSALKTKDVEKTYGTVKKLEILKVHQKAYEKELKKQLYQNLSPEQVEAFEFVSKQEKQFVADYAQVAFLQRGLLQQERQLQRTERALKAEKSLLQEVVATQKEHPKEIVKYGFTVENYQQEMKERFALLSSKATKWKQEQEKFEALKLNFEKVSYVHEKIVNKEFHAIYGTNGELSTIQKYHLVQEFKQYNEKVDTLDYEAFFTEKGLRQDRMQHRNPSQEELKRSITLTGFAILKQERLKKQALSKGNIEQVYEALKKVKELHLQKEEQLMAYQPYLYTQLHGEEKHAFDIVEQKLHTFPVDYRQVLSIQQSVAFTEKRLERREKELKVEKAVLQQVVEVHREEPEEVVKYGFTVDNYQQEMKERFDELSIKAHTWKEEKDNLEELKQHVQVITNVHERLLNQEFNQVYTEDMERTMIEKYHLIEEYKQYQEIVDPAHYEQFFAEKVYNKPVEPEVEITPEEQIEKIRKTVLGLGGLIRREEATREKFMEKLDVGLVNQLAQKVQSLLSNKEAVKEVEDEKTVGLYELTKKIQSLVLRRDEAYQAYKQLFAEKEGLSHTEVQAIEKVEQLAEKHILSYQDVQYIERNWQYENKQLQNEKEELQGEKAVLQQAHEAYKISKRSVAEHGFHPATFLQEFQQKFDTLKVAAFEIQGKLEAHEQLKEQLDIVTQVYERSVSNQYQRVFGEEIDLKQNTVEKLYHIQAYQLFGHKEEQANERMVYVQEKLSKQKEPTIYEQAKQLYASLRINQLSTWKQEKVKRDATEHRDYPTIYEASKKLEQLKLQKASLEADVEPLLAYQQLYLEKQFPHYIKAIQALDGVIINEIAERVRMKQECGVKYISFRQELKAYEKEIQHNQDKQQSFSPYTNRSLLDNVLVALEEVSQERNKRRLQKGRSRSGRRVHTKRLDTDLEL